jgi:CRP-like cAMP-binding protein
VFADCTDAQLRRVAKLFTPVAVPPGATVLEQGAPGREFVVLAEGRARVTCLTSEGAVEVAMITPGSFVGEMSLMLQTRCTATDTAVDPCVVHVAGVREFGGLMAEPAVRDRITGLAAQRAAKNRAVSVAPVLATLADGRTVAIRPLRYDDHRRLRTAASHCSATTLRRRFFSVPKFTETFVAHLADVDYRTDFAWAALTRDEAGEPVVGVGRYVRDREEPDAAEAAVTVADHFQGVGLGSLLAEALRVAALEHGIRRFTAMVLRENLDVHRLVTGWGGVLEPAADPALVHARVDLDGPGRGTELTTSDALRCAAIETLLSADAYFART